MEKKKKRKGKATDNKEKGVGSSREKKHRKREKRFQNNRTHTRIRKRNKKKEGKETNEESPPLAFFCISIPIFGWCFIHSVFSFFSFSIPLFFFRVASGACRERGVYLFSGLGRGPESQQHLRRARHIHTLVDTIKRTEQNSNR